MGKTTGGSQNLREKRFRKPRKSKEKRKLDALKRIYEVKNIHPQFIEEIKKSWQELKSKPGEEDQAEADSVLMSLVNINLSDLEIRSLLGVGSYRKKSNKSPLIL